jgi:CBS domain containing-hemolysin-like protein
MNSAEALVLFGSLMALFASAFFSAVEAAVFAARPAQLRGFHQKYPREVDAIMEVLIQPRKYLNTILFGNALSSALFVLGITLLSLGVYSKPSESGWWISIVVSSGLLILLGEFVPKALARRNETAVALGAVLYLKQIQKRWGPFLDYFDRRVQEWLIRLIPSSVRMIKGLSEEEYLTMLEAGLQEGALEPAERRLLERVLRLSHRNLRELMTPRSEILGLDVGMEIEEMKSKASAYRHRRLPIFNGSPDSPVGILNAKKFLLQPDLDLMDCIEPISAVPETMPAAELLKNFLRGPQRMALVLDEFGGVEGLITIENLLEEIFGEMFDEYDDEPPSWQEIEPGLFVVSGAAHLPEVSERLGVTLEAKGVDTVGGWFMEHLGALPRVGDNVHYRHLAFQVEKMHRLRVVTVLVRDLKRRKGS